MSEWLETRRTSIESGAMAVFFQDECHLVWGDACGYAWGPRHERLEVPMTNQRERQTYFGALNLATGQCLIQPSARGNGEQTVRYLQYLMSQCPHQQIVLLWDGASYHRSEAVKAFLAQVNAGLAAADWKITLLQFAPNDPTQNPIEDIWLKGKSWVRRFHQKCKTFAAVKLLFELETHCQVFDFPKLHRLGKFSLVN